MVTMRKRETATITSPANPAGLKLAQHIDLNTDTKVLTIDGEPFGYYLADEPVIVTIDSNSIPTIDIRLIAEHITVSPAPDAHDHQPVQHRDGKPPWCAACGLTTDGSVPLSSFDTD